MMNESFSSLNRLSKCSVCHSPAWNIDLVADEASGDVIQSYDRVRDSADAGCPGCALLHQAWIYTIPDDASRRGSELFFNRSQTRMKIFISNTKSEIWSHRIEVFTLPGM